jgi:hypothetical protein
MAGFRSGVENGALQAGIIKTHSVKLPDPLATGNIDALADLLRKAAHARLLGFGTTESAVDHVLKHVKVGDDVKTFTNDQGKLTQMAKEYYDEACVAISTGELVTFTLSQDGNIRSYKFGEDQHGEAVVVVSKDGSVRIATYIAPHRR